MTRLHAGAQPVVSLLLASSFWGAATVLNKALLGSLPPVTLLLIQLLASSMALWLLCWFLQTKLPRARTLYVVVLLGILNPGISYSFSMMGLQRIDAGISSLLWALEPFLILVLAGIFLREKVTLGAAVTIAAGFAGAVLVSEIFAQENSMAPDFLGTTWLLIAVMLCAVYTVAMRRAGQDADALALTAVQQVAGFAWAALLQILLSGSNLVTPLSEVTLGDGLAAALTGLIYYAAAYWLYLTALKQVSAGLAGASFNLIPLVTIAGAFLFLGERLSLMQVLGAVLIILSGLTLARLARRAVPLPVRRYVL